MPNCQICQTKLTENAKFCAECGVRLDGAVNERAWIIAMQERIKSVRHNDIIYNIVAVVGLLIAVVVPFVTHYVLLFTLDKISWVLMGVGVLLFISGFVANWLDNRKVKQIIILLQKGQPEAEIPAPNQAENTATD